MAIIYDAERKLFLLSTANTTYALGLAPEGFPVHLYFGASLAFPEDYPAPGGSRLSSFNSNVAELTAEYAARYGIQDIEPVLRVTFTDGTRDLRLAYAGHVITDDALALTLRDAHYGLEVRLEYRVYADCDLIGRRAILTNTGNEPFMLEEVLSGSVALPFERGEYRLTHLSGAWAMETLPDRAPVTPGRKVLEGRLNYSGHAHNPFFALDLLDAAGQGATETSGEVWYGAVEWSGNWKIVIEQNRVPFKFTRVSGGLNDFDFGWQLKAGESFETPWLVLGYSDAGFGQMSRNLHTYQNKYLLPPANAAALRPVLYNSWEAVMFSVNEAQQMELAEKAARIGAELFVMDDGWFGERHNDVAGLGDWTPNSQKFPNGLGPLAEKVNSLGMQFGIWVEPEMANPDSDLYRAHPDWVYHYANRPYTTGRNQLILNLCRQDVQEYLFGWLDALLANHNISYVKWDYNRGISEAGWPEAPLAQQREVWVRHTQALYDLVDKLRERHPKVLFEACSGGGGRVSLGTLAHFDHVWTSDNTDPLDRLPIQFGYSLAYSPKTMYCWVTDTDWNLGKYSLRYRFHSSFMGSLGVGSNLNHFSEEQLAEIAKLVEEYKKIRPLIQQGQFYRLTPLEETALPAAQYLAEDGQSGVVLAFKHRPHFWKNPYRLRLYGLEPEARYRLSGDLGEGEPTVASGQALMRRGILARLERHFSSALIYFEKA